jgi:hypothetical protein
LQLRSVLGNVPVNRAMVTQFETLAPDDTLQRAIEHFRAGFQHRAALAAAALGQEFVAGAAAVIVLVAVPGRTTEKYGARGLWYVHMGRSATPRRMSVSRRSHSISAASLSAPSTTTRSKRCSA